MPRAMAMRPISLANATLTACQLLSTNLPISATINGTSNSGASMPSYMPKRRLVIPCSRSPMTIFGGAK